MYWIRRRIYSGAVGWFLFAVAASATTGCASGPGGVAPGWRTGWVNSIAEGKDLIKNTKGSECVAALSPEQIERRRFAVVRYHQGRKSRPRTVLMPDSSYLRIGDKVRINIIDCTAPISRMPP